MASSVALIPFGSSPRAVDLPTIVALYSDDELGQAMFEWAIEQSRQRGCRLVQLTTNADRVDAGRFYERLGFKPTHIGMKMSLVEN